MSQLILKFDRLSDIREISTCIILDKEETEKYHILPGAFKELDNGWMEYITFDGLPKIIKQSLVEMYVTEDNVK